MVQASVIQQNRARTHWTQSGTSTLTCGSIFLLVNLSEFALWLGMLTRVLSLDLFLNPGKTISGLTRIETPSDNRPIVSGIIVTCRSALAID